MSSETIFFIIVVFLCLDFVLERVLESLNSKHMSPVLPDSLKGIYDEKEYSRFQSYKRENGRLDSWSSGVGFVVMIVFLVAGGFGWYNSWVVSLTDSVVWQTILFVVGLSVVSSVLDIPFDYYATFRIMRKSMVLTRLRGGSTGWIRERVGSFVGIGRGVVSTCGVVLHVGGDLFLVVRLGCCYPVFRVYGHVLLATDRTFV